MNRKFEYIYLFVCFRLSLKNIVEVGYFFPVHTKPMKHMVKRVDLIFNIYINYIINYYLNSIIPTLEVFQSKDSWTYPQYVSVMLNGLVFSILLGF